MVFLAELVAAVRMNSDRLMPISPAALVINSRSRSLSRTGVGDRRGNLFFVMRSVVSSSQQLQTTLFSWQKSRQKVKIGALVCDIDYTHQTNGNTKTYR